MITGSAMIRTNTISRKSPRIRRTLRSCKSLVYSYLYSTTNSDKNKTLKCINNRYMKLKNRSLARVVSRHVFKKTFFFVRFTTFNRSLFLWIYEQFFLNKNKMYTFPQGGNSPLVLFFVLTCRPVITLTLLSYIIIIMTPPMWFLCRLFIYLL